MSRSALLTFEASSSFGSPHQLFDKFKSSSLSFASLFVPALRFPQYYAELIVELTPTLSNMINSKPIIHSKLSKVNDFTTEVFTQWSFALTVSFANQIKTPWIFSLWFLKKMSTGSRFSSSCSCSTFYKSPSQSSSLFAFPRINLFAVISQVLSSFTLFKPASLQSTSLVPAFFRSTPKHVFKPTQFVFKLVALRFQVS